MAASDEGIGIEVQKSKPKGRIKAKMETNASFAARDLGIYGRTLSRAVTLAPSILAIETTPQKIDAIAQKALQQLRGVYYADGYSDDEKALLSNISSRGWSNNINNLTKRLNKMRLGHAGTHVLSVAYIHILNDILFPVEATEANVDKVQDTVGLAQEVLFKLEEEGGPLAQFATYLASVVVTKNKIVLSETEQLALANELRSQF